MTFPPEQVEKIKLDGLYRPEPVIGGTPPDCEWVCAAYARSGRKYAAPRLTRNTKVVARFADEASAQAHCDKLNRRPQ